MKNLSKVIKKIPDNILYRELMKRNLHGPKILVLDIETAPIIGSVWGLWQQNVSLKQIEHDWFVMSWAAKWLGEKEVFYLDQRNKKNKEDDRDMLKQIWNLINEADYVIAHNGAKFDMKKLNARFLLHGFLPPKPYKIIDTLRIARKHFALTSNKLEYLADKLNKKYKKSSHKKFHGFDLWKECLLGNQKAWIEMEKYNKMDILSLEEVYHKLVVWEPSIDFSVHYNDEDHVCSCGSTSFSKYGYAYSANSKKQIYRCNNCGKNKVGKTNLLTPKKKESLKK